MEQLINLVYNLFLAFLCTVQISKSDLNLTILHTNDVHCRFLSYNSQSRKCEAKDIEKNRCWGGAARRTSLVKKLRSEKKNVLFLDAGDQYQGTIWFTMLGWEPIAKYMNLIGYDAMCLGNHEFDKGVKGLVPFLKNITCPIVDSNLRSTYPKNPSSLDAMYSKKLFFYFLDEKGVNQTVAIIGYTSSITAEISKPGPEIEFQDEIQSLKEMVKVLKAQNINKIIALGHSGINMDRKVCREVAGVDLVIGGHTNTFLYSGKPPVDQTPEGPYPEVYRNTGENCLVVQAYAYGQYLGFLQANFDNNGVINRWNGNPILIDATVPEDEEMVHLLDPYASKLEHLEQTIIGNTSITIDTRLETCKRHECLTGNAITDAFIEYFRANGSTNNSHFGAPTICIINSGGLREILIQKDQHLTYGDVQTLMPFSDSIQRIKLKGVDLLAAMERSVENLCEDDTQGKFLQISGLKVKYDLTRPNYKRVVELLVSSELVKPNETSLEQVYRQLDKDKVYSIITNSYIINGGNGYTMIQNNLLGQDNSDVSDVDVLIWYLEKYKYLNAKMDNRIKYVNDENNLCTGSSNNWKKSNYYFILLILSIFYNQAIQ